MTRIIGGTAGGRRLRTPAGTATRPTSDRVREAFFSAVESRVGTLAGLSFLDLYAGSGAVGLEAASRGAVVVTLVERDTRTARLISQNARDLGVRVHTRTEPVERFVSGVAPTAYDVVYVDPPYDLATEQVHEILERLVGNGWVGRGSLAVVERSTRSVALTPPEGLQLDRTKQYGETMLWLLTATDESGGTDARP